MESQVELVERILRFIKHLPSDAGKDLIVLKGHLLIEELMSEIIIVHLSKSNPLEIRLDRNMMFNNKLNLCWALIGNKLNAEFWVCIKEFNSIRNSMSHSLEPKNIEDRLEKLSQRVTAYSDFNNIQYVGKELEFSISWLFVELNACLHSLTNS